ncbi:Fam189a2 [Columba guinea]|nr:Fam189a2 [Columba guinea]
MSLPVLLPGISSPVPGFAPSCPSPGASAGSLSTAAADPLLPPLRFGGCTPALPQYRNPRPTAPAPGAGLLPRRPLLSLGLLQVVLGCSVVALNFRALWLSSGPQVKNAYSFWAGSSVILSGILAIMSWKKPVMVLANLFVLLSIICVLLNVAGLVLGCQSIQFVSSTLGCDVVEKGEEKICICCEWSDATKCPDEETALKLYHVKPCNAARLLLKKVIFVLCALNALTTTVCLAAVSLRYSKIFLTRRSCIDESHVGEQDQVSDPDDFVPPVPPPSYFSTFCSCTPQSSHRMLGSGVIPLPHIYGARIKGIEVFCPLDPPPSYQAVCRQKTSEQESALQTSVVEAVDLGQVSGSEAFQGEEIPESSSRVSLSPPNASLLPAQGRDFHPVQQRSKSDSMLHCRLLQGFGPNELPSVMAPAQQATSLSARALPCGRHTRLPHVQSCCDLSVFTTDEEPLAETRIQRAEHERPHSIIGVVRETVL